MKYNAGRSREGGNRGNKTGSCEKKRERKLTFRIKHSFSAEDSTGRFVCRSGCQEVESNGSASPLSSHSCECDEPKCSSASAALRQTEFSIKGDEGDAAVDSSLFQANKMIVN